MADNGDMDVEENEVLEPSVNSDLFSFLLPEPVDTNADLEVDQEFKMVRPIKCKTGFLYNPHGCVRLSQGRTSVLCAVYGPSDIRLAKELPHRAAVDVLFRPKVTGVAQLSQITDNTNTERAIENVITGIFEATIHLDDDMGCGFNIVLQELDNDGCMFSTCINAASTALLLAGVSLRHMVAAVTFLVASNGSITIDPNQEQIKKNDGCVVSYVLSNADHILYHNVRGRVKSKFLKVTSHLAREAVKEVFQWQSTVVQLSTQDFLDLNLFATNEKQDKNAPKDIESGKLMDDVKQESLSSEGECSTSGEDL